MLDPLTAKGMGVGAMVAVSDLQAMLRGMEPILAPAPFGIVCQPSLPAGLTPFATVAEVEGLTVVAKKDELAAFGLAGDQDWALISLTLHSDLAAVGLTAALSRSLADEGISANVIAGFYHDHILVPWARRDDALAALKRLAHV